MSVTDASIVAQVAAKIAGDLVVAGKVTVEDMPSVQTDIFENTVALTGLSVEDFIKQESKKSYSNNGGGSRSGGGGGNSRGGGRSRGGNSRGNSDNNEDPGSTKFRGGKHAGRSIIEVLADDPTGEDEREGRGYLEWYADNVDNPFMSERINAVLQAA